MQAHPNCLCASSLLQKAIFLKSFFHKIHVEWQVKLFVFLVTVSLRPKMYCILGGQSRLQSAEQKTPVVLW